MNKKFLLLPLVAMTASVYASEEANIYITLSSENTKLTDEQLEQIASNINIPEQYQNLILTTESEHDKEQYVIKISNSQQLEALDALANSIKETTEFQTLTYFDEKPVSEIDTNKIKEAINMTLSEQEPTFTHNSELDKITIIPGIPAGTKYSDLNIDDSKAKFALKDIHAILPAALPTEIKNTQKFIADHGTNEIQLTKDMNLQQVKQAISEYISEQSIDLKTYQSIRKTLTDEKFLPVDIQGHQYKHINEQTIDPNSHSVKLIQHIKTQSQKIAELTEQMQQKENQISEMQKQLAAKTEELEKKTYKKDKSKRINAAAQYLEENVSIGIKEANQYIEYIYDAISKQAKKKYALPQLQPAETHNTTEKMAIQKAKFIAKDKATLDYYKTAQTLCFGTVDSQTKKPKLELTDKEIQQSIYNPQTDTTKTVQEITIKITNYNKTKNYNETDTNSIYNLSKAATLLYLNGKMNYDIQATFQTLIPLQPQIKNMTATQLQAKYAIQ